VASLLRVYGAGVQGRAVVVVEGIVGDDHQGGGGGGQLERTSYDTQTQPSTDKQK
jgi:hypothetical protein